MYNFRLMIQTNYPVTAGCRFYAVDALPLLDSSGEYYIDSVSGNLYFKPPTPLSADSEVWVSVLSSVLTVTSASKVFQNIEFSVSQGTLVEVEGEGVAVQNSSFSNAGGTCLSMSGQNSYVGDSSFSNVCLFL